MGNNPSGSHITRISSSVGSILVSTKQVNSAAIIYEAAPKVFLDRSEDRHAVVLVGDGGNGLLYLSNLPVV